MEHIKNIEIKNFKSIRHAKIEDCRRINVFIGYPNVGKSNLLEALSLFSVFQGGSLHKLIRLRGDTTMFYHGFIDHPIEVSVDESHNVKGIYKNSRLRLSYIHQLYSKSEPVRIFEFQNTNLLDSDVDTRSLHAGFQLLPVKRYEFNKKIEYKSAGIYDQLKIPYGENIFDVIRASELLTNEVSELFKNYNLEMFYDAREQDFKIMRRIGSTIFSTPYELIADTLQRLIFFKVAIEVNSASILLFEEPEAHMFPPYISKFTSDIWQKKDNQYFITTHSPFVLNDIMENDKEELAIFVLEYKDGETIIQRLTEKEIYEAYQHGLDLFMHIKSFVE